MNVRNASLTATTNPPSSTGDEQFAAPKLGNKPLQRREWLKQSAKLSTVFAIPTILPASALGLDGKAAPSERVHLGVIGIGPRCRYVLKPILGFSDVRCKVIADVQSSRRDEGKKFVDESYGNGDCHTVRDFREVLDDKDIDAVLIATGDRWHATASILAAQSGKDIYCEKPCGLTIEFCQKIDDVIRETGRIFQAGTQRRSVPNFQKAAEMARSGQLGKIERLVASVYVPSIETAWLPGEPTPNRDVVDWNMWLGPAPWRPYNSQYVAGKWRGQWDFDSGARLLDWGAHTVDLCQLANGSDDDLPIEYKPSEKGIECTYSSGVVLQIDFLETPFGNRPGWIQSNGTCPVRFMGSDAWVETGDSGEIHVHRDGQTRDVSEKATRKNGLDVDLHARNFFDSMKSRKPTAANSRIMRRSHIACHAAAIAWLLKRPLQLDPVSETFIKDDEANQIRSRPSRTDWA